MTRIIKILLTVLMLAFYGNASAQDKTFFNSNYKPKSETNALIWSVSGTFLPVATGLGILFTDKGKIKRHYNPYTDHWYTYRESPNPTLPIILMISGVVVGPSFGYFYGGCNNRGVRGILVRVGTGALTLAIGGSIATSHRSDEWMDFSGLVAFIVVCAVGSVVILGEAIIDIVEVSEAVRERNEESRQKNQTSVTLMPKYFADSGVGGLELRIRF